MSDAGADAPAIYGPPWRPVSRGEAEAILATSRSTVVRAYAVYSPGRGTLERSADEAAAIARAVVAAAEGDGEAAVHHHVARVGKTAWLWLPGARVEIEKALDPTRRADFDVLVERTRQEIARQARVAEREARRLGRAALEVDWEDENRAAVEVAIRTARNAIAAVPDHGGLLTIFRERLPALAVRVADATGRSSGGRGISLEAASMATRIGLQQEAKVRDEFARRAIAWENDAREIIFGGLRARLDDSEITRRLREALDLRLSARDDFYFALVAGAVAGRARSIGALEGLRTKGVEAYVWTAVIDSRTCDVCRFLHGTRFEVAAAMEQIANADETGPPWYGVKGREIRSGGRTVARIRRTGVGTRQRGSYRSVGKLETAGGTMSPPAHGYCRCRLRPAPPEPRG